RTVRPAGSTARRKLPRPSALLTPLADPNRQFGESLRSPPFRRRQNRRRPRPENEMKRPWRMLLGTMMFVFAAHDASAQHDGTSAAPAPSTPAEARQFDFLLGQWEVDVKPKVGGLAAMIHGSPKLSGSWKAWRALDGLGVEDELRIADGSGNPMSLSQALRVFDRNQGRWAIVGVDAYRARISNSTAQWQEGEMRVTGNGVDNEGKTYLSRTRYYDIGADAFRMQQDRLYDDGQSWDEATLVIDARRVAAAASR